MPTFPITIDEQGAGPITLNLGVLSSDGVFVKNATDRYVLGTDLNDGVVAMFKSVLAGAQGSWVIQDEANAPPGGACACVDGQVIRVFTSTDTTIQCYEFDTDTDTWSELLGETALPADATGTLGSCGLLNGITYLSGIFTFYPQTPPSPDVQWPGYITYSAGTFGSYVNLNNGPFDFPRGGSTSALKAVVVTASRIHLFTSLAAHLTDAPEEEPAHGFLFSTEMSSGSEDINEITGTEYATDFEQGSPPDIVVGCAGGANISIAVTSFAGQASQPPNQVGLSTVVDADAPNLDFAYQDVIGNTDTVPGIACCLVDAQPYIFYTQLNTVGEVNFSDYYKRVAGVDTFIGSVVSSSSFRFSSAPTNIDSVFAIAFAITPEILNSLDYWEDVSVTPVIATVSANVGGGATYFPRFFNKSFLIESIARIYGTRFSGRGRSGGRGINDDSGADWFTLRDNPPLSSFFLFPNHNDLCLSREFILYNYIDRQAMSCARKPECFLRSERDWLDSPTGWRVFNPVGVLSLPAPSGDVVVFSFRVPYGYDGVITAQYHSYTLGFSEGSGDLAWRVRADGRYLRDCGDMEVSLGNPKQLSPVNGGLQLRSGNLVEYLVSAPNTSGLLPPGGNILAGLHGFFYPRM